MRSLFLRRLAVVLAALAGTTAVGFTADVAFDDFEGLTMKPFDEANVTIGDGTDWTEVITGWTVTNPANHEPTDAEAYNGWRAMDVDSWIEEQGVQAGRDRMQLGANNTALVADPDAWDDFPPGGKTDQGFNSYVSRSYDITGRDLATLELSFDWDFVTEDRQIGVVDVSFDGGTTYQNLVTVASSDWAGDATWGPFSVADQLRYTTNPNGHANDASKAPSMASLQSTRRRGSMSKAEPMGQAVKTEILC